MEQPEAREKELAMKTQSTGAARVQADMFGKADIGLDSYLPPRGFVPNSEAVGTEGIVGLA